MAVLGANPVSSPYVSNVHHRFRRPATILDPVIDDVSIVDITRLSSTQIQITFQTPLIDNAALRSTDSYEIRDQAGVAPDRVVTAVTPEDTAYPSYVVLTMDEQRSGVTYEVEVFRLTSAG